MAKSERRFEPVPSSGRSMIYRTDNEMTLRLRTSNDHVLVIVANPQGDSWDLNIKGTDLVLVVMPTHPRSVGEVRGFLVPTDVLVDAVFDEYRSPLSMPPSSDATPYAVPLAFGASSDDGSSFATTWEKYLLEASVDAGDFISEPDKRPTARPSPRGRRKRFHQEPLSSDQSVADIISDAKRRIARITGVPVEAVSVEVRIES